MPTARPSDVSVRVTDSEGYSAVCTAYATFGINDTVGAIQTGLQNWLSQLDKVTGAVLTQCFYKQSIPLPGGLKAAATTGAVNARGLGVRFTNTVDAEPWLFSMPALDLACKLQGGPDMAQGHTIDTLTEIMITAIPGTSGNFVNNHNNPLLLETRGTFITRKHRKQLQGGSARPGV